MALEPQSLAEEANETERKERQQRTALLVRARTYVTRYGGSTTRLTNKLTEWATRRPDLYGEASQTEDFVAYILQVLHDEGSARDDDFIRLRLSALLRRGCSTRMATATLKQEGYQEDDIANGIAQISSKLSHDVNLIAAFAFAKRRGFPPFAKTKYRTKVPTRAKSWHQPGDQPDTYPDDQDHQDEQPPMVSGGGGVEPGDGYSRSGWATAHDDAMVDSMDDDDGNADGNADADWDTHGGRPFVSPKKNGFRLPKQVGGDHRTLQTVEG